MTKERDERFLSLLEILAKTIHLNPSISLPSLIASSDPDVAVASSSSVSPEPKRTGSKRKPFEDLIREMEAERE